MMSEKPTLEKAIEQRYVLNCYSCGYDGSFFDEDNEVYNIIYEAARSWQSEGWKAKRFDEIRAKVDAGTHVLVPVEPNGDMVVGFNEALDNRRAWVNQIQDGLVAAIKAAPKNDLLGD